MTEYLDRFYATENIQDRWQICQQYIDAHWAIELRGIDAGGESDGGKFMVTTMPLVGYSRKICIATKGYPQMGVAHLCVQPPRSLSDLQDCNCPLICYGEQ